MQPRHVLENLDPFVTAMLKKLCHSKMIDMHVKLITNWQHSSNQNNHNSKIYHLNNTQETFHCEYILPKLYIQHFSSKY